MSQTTTHGKAKSRLLASGLLASLLACTGVQQVRAGEDAMKVRLPAAQGSFYPDDPEVLARMVDRCLAQTTPALPPGRVRAVISPHAGYIYSGTVAGKAIRQIPEETRRVVILAPSHHVGFEEGAMPGAAVFRNALGDVPVDAAAAELVKTCPTLFRNLPQAHEREHSLEVMLPFLQRRLKTFTLVPIVIGQNVSAVSMAKALSPLLDEARTTLIASTDLSHYHPYAAAVELDSQCIKSILALDSRALEQRELCGKSPVAVLVELARLRGWRPVQIAYLNSGDTAGDKNQVVGYAAIAFIEPSGTAEVAVTPISESKAAGAKAADSAETAPPPLVSPDDQKALLRLARETILAQLDRKPLPELPKGTAVLDQKLGCFVTLQKAGDLRGCIGNILPAYPLAEGIRRNALNAAFDDPRFNPVTPAEMAQIDIEISVLTVPKPLPFKDAADLLRQLKPGVHGLVLSQDFMHRSTFLPQVWEQIPDKEAFLQQLCLKGAMAPDAWRDPGKMAVETYEAFVFGEKTTP